MTDIHHISKFFEINEPSSQEFTPTAFSRNLLAANYDQIRHNLLDVNWDNLLVDDHVDHLVDKFYIKMQKVIDTHVRIVKQSPRSYPKWYDEELISLIQSKKRAYCDWKRIRTIDCFIEFKRIRAMCIRLSRSKYQDYMRSVESAVKRNIHSFWSYIKNNKKESGIPSNTFWNSTSANNDHETTNLFAAFFGSVYINNNIEEVSRLECTDEIFSDIQLSEESLQTIISGLDNNVNPGPDGILSFFVKKCWSAIKKPICIIFKAMLKAGYVPKTWKFSYTLPVFKSGNKHDVTNYRPICICSCLPKVFDCLLTNELFSRLLGKISMFQHGFISGRSTLTNLLIFNDFLSESFENRQQVDAISTDFSKAFDRVSHKRLTSNCLISVSVVIFSH